jgi:hypothetical protein
MLLKRRPSGAGRHHPGRILFDGKVIVAVGVSTPVGAHDDPISVAGAHALDAARKLLWCLTQRNAAGRAVNATL